jgi:hypothetical protein
MANLVEIMIRSANDIIARCESLAAGGWHPGYCVTLDWWSDTGWHLTIELSDWVGFGTPLEELPVCYNLPVEYAVNPLTLEGCKLPQGISLMGGSRAPAYKEALNIANPEWHEQAEAIIADLWQRADGSLAGTDKGYSDLRKTAYKAEHRWHRCKVWRWETDDNKALRDMAESQWVDKALASIPSAEEPVKMQGRKMLVLRPCGCVTAHWQAPGNNRRPRGGLMAPSRLRFGAWLSTQSCLVCLAK